MKTQHILNTDPAFEKYGGIVHDGSDYRRPSNPYGDKVCIQVKQAENNVDYGLFSIRWQAAKQMECVAKPMD